MTQKWNESKEGRWNENPKRFCLLSEHYYEKDIDEIAIKKQIANQVKNCILNFEKSFLPRFSSVEDIQEIKILTPETPEILNILFLRELKFIQFQIMPIELIMIFISMIGKLAR